MTLLISVFAFGALVKPLTRGPSCAIAQVSMPHDYYQVLGVNPDADFNAIRQAYRQKALQNHPDKGGSHLAMVRINEAWNILANPVTRSEYDKFRGSGAPAEDFHTPAAEQARKDATVYPEHWNEFDKWLFNVGADFRDTKFEGTGFFTNTRSGGLFVAGGIALPLLGFIVFLVMTPPGSRWGGGVVVFLKIGLPVGAALGAFAHFCVKKLFFDEPKTKAPFTASTAQFKTVKAVEAPVSEKIVIGCLKCGQRLRIPKLSRTIKVTCRTCGHVFVTTPGS